MKKFNLINMNVNVILRSGLAINGQHLDMNKYNNNLEYVNDKNNDIIKIFDLKDNLLFSRKTS